MAHPAQPRTHPPRFVGDTSFAAQLLQSQGKEGTAPQQHPKGEEVLSFQHQAYKTSQSWCHCSEPMLGAHPHCSACSAHLQASPQLPAQLTEQQMCPVG